jgi:Immunity protein 58
MIAAHGWKIAVVLLGLICLVLLYRVVDQGITRTYSDASAESANRHIQVLKGLVSHEWLGLPEAQVEARLNAFVASQPPNTIVLKRERDEKNVIYLEGFRFEFRDGKLFKVT